MKALIKNNTTGRYKKKRPAWLLIEPALSDVCYVEEINGCNTTKLLSLMDLLLRPLNTRSYVLGALAGN